MLLVLLATELGTARGRAAGMGLHQPGHPGEGDVGGFGRCGVESSALQPLQHHCRERYLAMRDPQVLLEEGGKGDPDLMRWWLSLPSSKQEHLPRALEGEGGTTF